MLSWKRSGFWKSVPVPMQVVGEVTTDAAKRTKQGMPKVGLTPVFLNWLTSRLRVRCRPRVKR